MEQILAIAQFIAIDYREEILAALLIAFLLLILIRVRTKRPGQRDEPVDSRQLPDSEDVRTDEEDRESSQAVYDIDDEFADAATEEIEEEPELEESVGAYGIRPDGIRPDSIRPEETPVAAVSFFDRLKSGLSKTRQSLSKKFDGIFSGNRKIDDTVLEEIEEVLITSDVGVATTMELIRRISQNAPHIKTPEDFKSHLKTEMLSFVDLPNKSAVRAKPHVILMVGVNGVGKTTTIGKLAAQYSAQGKKVLLSASDTFRAAAVEQLQIWADRAGADIVRHRDKADPAAVAFDSVEAAIARGTDIVIVDTAGRIQTKVNLMEQLKKIKRSISKTLPDAPHEVLLVLDATTGQNAVSQAKLFHEGIGVTGIILAKLDGTAKGGIVLSICHTLNVPIRFIGIGEGIEDLQEFDPKLFIDALL